MQLYLQRPELRVSVPEALLHGEGATASSTCKVREAGRAEEHPDLPIGNRNLDQDSEKHVSLGVLIT